MAEDSAQSVDRARGCFLGEHPPSAKSSLPRTPHQRSPRDLCKAQNAAVANVMATKTPVPSPVPKSVTFQDLKYLRADEAAQIFTRKSSHLENERRKRRGRHPESSFCRVFLHVATPQNTAALLPRGSRAGATPLTQKRSARRQSPVLVAERWGARGLGWGAVL